MRWLCHCTCSFDRARATSSTAMMRPLSCLRTSRPARPPALQELSCVRAAKPPAQAQGGSTTDCTPCCDSSAAGRVACRRHRGRRAHGAPRRRREAACRHFPPRHRRDPGPAGRDAGAWGPLVALGANNSTALLAWRHTR